MADVSSPIPMGSAPEKHNWLLIAGAVAGVAGLFLLLKNQGNQGTVAAGTSINAALGSIQEENMNLLGTTQAGFQGASQQLGAAESNIVAQDLANTQNVTNAVNQGFGTVNSNIGSLSGQVSQGFTNTQGLLGTLEADITQQLTAFSGQTQNNFNNLNNLIQNGQASQAQVSAAQTSLMQSIQQDIQSGLVGQQQANALLNTISTQQQQAGAFSGWEFYQIPNRYSAYIPAGLNPPGWS